MTKFHTALATGAMLLSATITSAQETRSFKLEPLWQTSGFSMPESVASIPDHPWIYVSNVNGEDKPGFISRVALDGTIETLKWVDGLSGPTGMVAFQGQLYVVDQTQLHQIDLSTGVITQSFVSPTATSLNDVDVTPGGQIFVSELQGGTIHTVEGDALVPWLASTDFPFPNGVLALGGDVLVGNFGTELSRDLTPQDYGTIYRINTQDRAIDALPATDKMGTWDGLAAYGDGFLASSPFNNSLWYFTDRGKSLIGHIDGGVADIGTGAGQLFAPQIFAGSVTAYGLEAFAWTRISTAEGFAAQVVGEPFGDDSGASIAKADGTLTGTFGGQELRGTWAWEGDFFCRTSTLGDVDLGHDCLIIEVTDSQMRLTLQQGTGPSIIYDRKD